jgi:hypothetical protein
MRRILVEGARRKQIIPWVEMNEGDLALKDDDRVLELSDALEVLARQEPRAVQLVKPRIFVGVSVEEAAAMLGVSRAEAYRDWTYARAWLSATFSGQNDIS